MILNNSSLITKILWSLAPLIWGSVTWFLAWGPGKAIPISYEVRVILGLIVLTAIFYKTLEYGRLHTRVTFFSLPLYFPDWRWLLAPSLALLIINSFFPATEVTLLSSMAFGIFAGPFLEELLARCFFIKYRMSDVEFLILNIISAATFTVMHAGYCTPAPTVYTLFFERGHFGFALMLGIIAYKTKRIEVPIIVHMLSNLANYTLPTVILQQPMPTWGYTIFYCIQLLLVGGALGLNKKTRDEANPF